MEIKYFVFFLAVMAVVPMSFLCFLSEKCLKAAVFLIPVFLIFYNNTAINFLSVPHYKGTALGFEISFIHLLAVVILAAMFLRQWPVKVFFPGIGFYILFFIVCVLSAFNAPNKTFSAFELMKMLTFFIVFLAVANYLYITHDFDAFLYGIATVVSYSFLVAFKLKYLEGRFQANGIFPHQNSAGMFMCLVGPLFLSRLLNRRDSIFKTGLFLLLFLITFISTLFTFSRGSIICFPIGCAVTVILSLLINLNSKTFIVAVVAFFLGGLAAIYSSPNLYRRFTGAPEASKNMRKMLARTALNIMKDKPLLGCGINNWGIVGKSPRYNPFIGTNFIFGPDDYIGLVETTYLLVGAECGLLGLTTLFCWYLFYLIQAIYQSFRWKKTDQFYLLVGLSGGFMANFLQSTLEWVLKQQINFCLLFCCFGIVSALAQGTREHTVLSKLEAIAQRREEIRRRYEQEVTSA